jgi:hypothetical protein
VIQAGRTADLWQTSTASNLKHLNMGQIPARNGVPYLAAIDPIAGQPVRSSRGAAKPLRTPAPGQ